MGVTNKLGLVCLLIGEASAPAKTISPRRDSKYHSARGNVHECFPKHFSIRTARMKYDKETDEEKTRGVSTERSKAGTNKKVATAYRYLINLQYY